MRAVLVIEDFALALGVLVVLALVSPALASTPAPSSQEVRTLFDAIGIHDPQQIARVPNSRSGSFEYSALEPPHQAGVELCISRQVWLIAKPSAEHGFTPELKEATTLWFAGDCTSAKFGTFRRALRISPDELTAVFDAVLKAAHGDASLGVPEHFDSDEVRTAAAGSKMSDVWQIEREGKYGIHCSFFAPALRPNMLSVELNYLDGRLTDSRIYLEDGPDIVATPTRQRIAPSK
jgi:hypothetical protein